MPKLLTIGDIAKQAGEPIHRVIYIVRARGIAPVWRTGSLRLFDVAAVERIVSELKEVKN